MVGDHVAQRAGAVVITAAVFHPDRFGHRHLHVIHVAAVPDRLEDAVGEAEHHDVLHRLFAQVVIDEENLILADYFQDLAAEIARRFKIVSKRLLDNDTPPVAVGLEKAFAGQTLHYRKKKLRRGCEIKQIIAAGLKVAIQSGKHLAQLLPALVGIEIGRNEAYARYQLVHQCVVAFLPELLAQTAGKRIAQLLLADFSQGETGDGNLFRHETIVN